MHLIFSILTVRLIGQNAQRVEGGISVPPQFEPLNSAYALDFPISICAAMDIRPNHIDIVEIEQILPAQVALKLDRAFDRRKFIPDDDVLIMNTDPFI